MIPVPRRSLSPGKGSGGKGGGKDRPKSQGKDDNKKDKKGQGKGKAAVLLLSTALGVSSISLRADVLSPIASTRISPLRPLRRINGSSAKKAE